MTRAEIMQEARNTNELTNLKELSRKQLQETLSELGQPAFRVKQIEEWVWEKGATSFDDMTNLPKALRATLAERFTLGGVTEVAKQVSEDGSRKYLLQYADGTTVECVGMPSGNKLAVCVSSQAGCAMGCAFCATMCPDCIITVEK
jgi:23S rRNA (adenine2503-C2)-methyltransferase